MYIAKMVTNYPDYHGSGYYNFIIESDEDTLDAKIEDNSHDFRLDSKVSTRHDSVEAVIKAYPSKKLLNDKYFEGK